MGFAPAGLIPLVLVTLFQCFGLVFGLNALQVGRPEAGIDIRIPLNAFQCDRYLVYHKVAPNDYGRSLGINYDDVALHFTTPDDARRVFLRLGIPSSGEGVISWQVNLRQGTRFWVAPHGPIQQGEVVGVELGGAGADCLGIGTRTANEPFVTYDGSVYQSVQNQLQTVSTRFPNQMTTSPEAGLQTRIAAAGVVVAPQAVVPTPTPSSPSNTSQDPGNNPTSDITSISGQEPANSQSGQPPESSGSANSSLTDKAGSNPTDSSNTSNPSTTNKGGNDLPTNTDKGGSSQPSQTDADAPEGPDSLNFASRKPNIVPIIIGVVAGVVLVAAAIACWFILRRRRQRLRTPQVAPYTMIESGIATPGTISSAQLVGAGTPRPAGKMSLHPQNRFFPDSSYAPSEPSTVPVSPTVPMDLARALAVVAAHVRSGEDIHADPTASAPPEYSRAAAATPTATWSGHHISENSSERTMAGSSSTPHKR